MRSLLRLSSLIASLVVFVLARDFEIRHKAIPNKRHAHARDLNDVRNRSLTNDFAVLDGRGLEKRFDGARITFYDAGLGACGTYNTNADFIVALNIAQWDNKQHCGEMITIVYGGKSTTAQIMDQCPGCPYLGLDLSRGLFNYFSPESAGVITGSWYFGGAPADTPTPTPTPTPTTTYAPAPTPTTNYVPPVTTTPTTTPLAYTPIPSSSTVLSSSSSTTPLISSTSSALNALISSSPNTTTSSLEGVLEQLNRLLVQYGGIVVVGGSQSN